MMVPLYVGRASSIQAVNAAVAHDGEILLCAQKEARTNSPKPGEIYEIGTVGNVMQHIKRPDGTVKILVEGGANVAAAREIPHERGVDHLPSHTTIRFAGTHMQDATMRIQGQKTGS